MSIEPLNSKLTAAKSARKESYEKALSLLEEAHLIAQPFAKAHVLVHWKMLTLAWKFKDWKEFVGQIPRLILAAPGSVFGMAPKGNVGTTKMGIFEIRE